MNLFTFSFSSHVLVELWKLQKWEFFAAQSFQAQVALVLDWRELLLLHFPIHFFFFASVKSKYDGLRCSLHVLVHYAGGVMMLRSPLEFYAGFGFSLLNFSLHWIYITKFKIDSKCSTHDKIQNNLFLWSFVVLITTALAVHFIPLVFKYRFS